MSASRVVADRYAKALLSIVSREPGALDRVDDELDALALLLQSNRKFVAFLENPQIRPVDKKNVVKKALASQLSPATLHLVLLLIDKHRERELLGIAQRFSLLADLERGVQEAEVISAVPLPADQLERLTKEVQRFSQHNIKLVAKVDPALIGGVVLKLGNRVIDGSVRYRLDEMKRSLQSATVH